MAYLSSFLPFAFHSDLPSHIPKWSRPLTHTSRWDLEALHVEPTAWRAQGMARAICYRLFSLWVGVFILTPSASGPLFISRSSHLPLSAHEDRVSILALGQHMYGQRQSSGKAIFCSLSSRKHCQFPAQEHRAEPELCLQCKHLPSLPSCSQWAASAFTPAKDLLVRRQAQMHLTFSKGHL